MNIPSRKFKTPTLKFQLSVHYVTGEKGNLTRLERLIPHTGKLGKLPAFMLTNKQQARAFRLLAIAR